MEKRPMPHFSNSRYHEQFINSVIEQVNQQDKLLSTIAKENGVPTKTLYRWVQEAKGSTKNRESQLQLQINALQSKLNDLTQQLQLIR